VHFSTVFVDESGDLGFGQGSSKYITIGALVTTHPEIVQRIPQRIRKRRLKKSLLQKPELKFHNSSPDIRKRVLKMVVALEDLSIASITVNKIGMPDGLRHSPERFYDCICGELLADIIVARGGRGAYKVVFDARPHNRPPNYDFGGRIGAIVERELTRLGLLPVRINVSVIDSHNSGGLQTADFVVGSIQRKHARDDCSYYGIIAPAIVVEKMLF
jgi:hypothetical protein